MLQRGMLHFSAGSESAVADLYRNAFAAVNNKDCSRGYLPAVFMSISGTFRAYES